MINVARKKILRSFISICHSKDKRWNLNKCKLPSVRLFSGMRTDVACEGAFLVDFICRSTCSWRAVHPCRYARVLLACYSCGLGVWSSPLPLVHSRWSLENLIFLFFFFCRLWCCMINIVAVLIKKIPSVLPSWELKNLGILVQLLKSEKGLLQITNYDKEKKWIN